MKTLTLAVVLVLAASTTHAAIIMSCDNKDGGTAALVRAAGADEGTALAAAPEAVGLTGPGALAQGGRAPVDPAHLDPEPLHTPSRIVAALGPIGPELKPDIEIDGVNNAPGRASYGIWSLGDRDTDLPRVGLPEEIEKDHPSLAADSTAAPSSAGTSTPTAASNDLGEEDLNVVPPGSPAPFALAFLCGGLGLILVGRR
jgi:hypothetical protein